VVFQFDPKKRVANTINHKIGFLELQALWIDPQRVELPAHR
jgi:uncharacterized DUF497 family protein